MPGPVSEILARLTAAHLQDQSCAGPQPITCHRFPLQRPGGDSPLPPALPFPAPALCPSPPLVAPGVLLLWPKPQPTLSEITTPSPTTTARRHGQHVPVLEVQVPPVEHCMCTLVPNCSGPQDQPSTCQPEAAQPSNVLAPHVHWTPAHLCSYYDASGEERSGDEGVLHQLDRRDPCHCHSC